MTDDVGPSLDVTADLHLDVDGVSVQITGQGDRVDVRTDHPMRLAWSARAAVRALPARKSRSAIRSAVTAAAVVRRSGLTVAVHGPHGQVAELVPDHAGGHRARVLPVPGLRMSPAALIDARRAVTAVSATAVLGIVVGATYRRRHSRLKHIDRS